jgi:hypothetical protein
MSTMDSQQVFLNINTKTKLLLNRFSDKKKKIFDLVSAKITKKEKSELNKILEDLDLIFNEQMTYQWKRTILNKN